MAIAAHPGALVIRTSWLMSSTHSNFAAIMLARIAEGPVQVVDDQRGRPTFADDLALATLGAVDKCVSGILHLTNQGDATWYQLAREIAEISGLEPDRVLPCSSADCPRPGQRPENSVLDSERVASLDLQPLPHYRHSLETTVEELIASGHLDHAD